MGDEHMQKITLQQNALQGNAPVEIQFPDDWEVEYHALPGDSAPPLTKTQIMAALDNPHGMKPLRELAVGRKEAIIVFDDNSRGTPVRPVAQAVLEILHGAGFTKDRIQFLCALGTHGANNRRDFAAKLGEEIVRNYRVFNHNCYDNCVSIGQTATGMDVSINKEFMACDLRIGIGALTPHVNNAFGGGGKLLFPGIASIDTTFVNHTTTNNYLTQHQIERPKVMGDMNVRVMRDEVEEMTRMVGEFFKIDTIYNSKLDLIDMYAGDPVDAYYAGVPAAKKFYAIHMSKTKKDIVVINANAKANEAAIALALGNYCLKDGGVSVMVDYTSLGQVTHYLYSAFGKTIYGRLSAGTMNNVGQASRVIFNMPYPNPGDNSWYGPDDQLTYTDTWDETLALLQKTHGPGTTVSVIADGTISYFAD